MLEVINQIRQKADSLSNQVDSTLATKLRLTQQIQSLQSKKSN
ncbi:hypothetical protein [Mycoplasma sp. HU2014]|nr:hypothetical protein [Mycoplasma sp. HU2014]